MCSTDGECEYRESYARSAKDLKCVECELTIPAGELYLMAELSYDAEPGDDESGTWEEHPTHVGCKAVAEFVRTKICEAQGEHGFVPIGGLENEIEACRDYIIKVTPEDEADCRAMGLSDFEEWDENERVGCYEEMAAWVWDIARAQYREAR